MATPRRHTINLETTPYYHCTSRCVRRAFLCGKDDYTGQSYEHRRDWVESWLLKLTQAFCIDVVAYAVMPNHYHIILHTDMPKWKALSDEAIIDRYQMIHRRDPLMARYRKGDEVSESERREIKKTLRNWHDTLINISRFMGYMNERIARAANKEDECTGRFWEGRFHSQALLDEAALLQCMTYVDLNPIRAGIANTPEESDYTSVKHRIDQRRQNKADQLMAFLTSESDSDQPNIDTEHTDQVSNNRIPITFPHYLDLLDWTGRILREDKAGAIDSSAPDILSRLGFTQGQWTDQINTPAHWRLKALGPPARVDEFAQSIGQKWVCQHTNPPDS